MSVDVEDWFQVWALSSRISRSEWDRFELRVEANTRRILDLFDRYDAKATFFVLGWVAERRPQLVKAVSDAGHEIASHGWDHTKVFEQDADTFHDDVVRTRNLLQDLSGQAVIGYRAAGFSIDQRTPFAYEVLAEAGHLYSSSSHPIRHDHYGDAAAPLDPSWTHSVTELPVAVCEIAGHRQSCAGGGWFRILPYVVSSALWQRVDRDGRRAIFYFHPWELDPEQPSVKGLSLKSRLRHRTGLASMERKLSRLLGSYRWDRIDRLFAEEIAATAGPNP
jgi:polysaccharide deacetylase family protein (PEP-CTERM system associated)